MTGSKFEKLWEENKRFLLYTGSAFLVFLLARSFFVNPYISKASDTRDENRALEDRVKRLFSGIKYQYHREKGQRDSLASVEDELLSRFALSLPKSQRNLRRDATKEVVFNERISSIWEEVKSKADQINCRLPSKISTRQLGVSRDDSELDDLRNSRYLEVLRRALHAMVDAGVRTIGKPRVHREEEYEIEGNAEKRIVFQRIDFQVTGTYESFVEVFRQVQKPERFLQALLMELSEGSKSGGGVLSGRIEFAGFFYEAAGESPKRGRRR